MRFLKWLAVLLVLLFCGGWFAAKYAIEGAASRAIAEASAKGVRADIGQLSVSGFPMRIDLQARDVALADPVSGMGWQGALLSIHAPSLTPWALTADLPAEQVVTLPDQTITLRGEALQAFLTSAPDPNLPMRSLKASASSLEARSDLGWQIGFGEVSASLTEEVSAEPNSYALTFDLAPLRPDPAFLAALAAVGLPDMPKSDLPPEVQQIDGDLSLRLSAPLDRFAAERRPQIAAVDIRALTLAWGALSLSATGAITADAEGYAAGKVSLEMRGWDRLPAVLVASGKVKPEVAPTIAGFLRAITSQNAEPDILALPLVMENGRMSLGPFPLGPAPLLRAPLG